MRHACNFANYWGSFPLLVSCFATAALAFALVSDAVSLAQGTFPRVFSTFRVSKVHFHLFAAYFWCYVPIKYVEWMQNSFRAILYRCMVIVFQKIFKPFLMTSLINLHVLCEQTNEEKNFVTVLCGLLLDFSSEIEKIEKDRKTVELSCSIPWNNFLFPFLPFSAIVGAQWNDRFSVSIHSAAGCTASRLHCICHRYLMKGFIRLV